MKKVFFIGLLMTIATSAQAGNGQVGSTGVVQSGLDTTLSSGDSIVVRGILVSCSHNTSSKWQGPILNLPPGSMITLANSAKDSEDKISCMYMSSDQAAEREDSMGASAHLKSMVLPKVSTYVQAKADCARLAPQGTWHLPGTFDEVLLAANDNTKEVTKLPVVAGDGRNSYLLWADDGGKAGGSNLVKYTDGPDAGNTEEIPANFKSRLDARLKSGDLAPEDKIAFKALEKSIADGPRLICIRGVQ